MRKLNLLFFFWIFGACSLLLAQNVSVEGYVFEEGNRVYLNAAKVTFLQANSQSVVGQSVSNMDGVFKAELPLGYDYVVKVEKDLFQTLEKPLSTIGKTNGEKLFCQVPDAAPTRLYFRCHPGRKSR